MLSVINQTLNNKHLHVESLKKKVKLIEADNRKVVARGWREVGEIGSL